MTSPFKFLDSFAKDDREVYFGRGRETEEVYSRIFQSRLLLVYGLSGTGKSSLIQCGLGNRLNDSDWLPISIRRAEDIMASLSRALQRHALSPTGTAPAKLTGKAVKLAIRSLYLDHFKPIYLIFDQFEELFIFGTDDERQRFVNLVADVLASDLQCKFIFVIREEYLANLTEFEGDLPELFSNRIRIEKMTRAQAREAIEGPCQVAGIALEDGFADALLHRISPDRNEVELTYLQVYLDRLWRLATEKGQQPQFTLAMLDDSGSITDLLGAFLEEQVARMPAPQHALALLKAFVSTRGTKRQNTLEETQAHARILGTDLGTDEVLALTDRFVSLRILRDKDDNGRYELRHDALAAKVYEKITLVEKELLEVRQFVENAYQNYLKRGLLLTALDMDYLRPYLSSLFLTSEVTDFIAASEREIKRQKMVRRCLLFGISGTVIGLLFAYLGYTNYEQRIENERMMEVLKNARVFATADMMNVLYLGVDNPMTISLPGVACEDLEPLIENGDLIKREECGEYIVRVNGVGLVKITARVRLNGDTLTLGTPSVFRVKQLPDPKPSIVSLIGSGNVTKDELIAAKKLHLKYVNSDFNVSRTVSSFRMTWRTDGKEKIFFNRSGNDLTPEMKDVLRSVEVGDELVFDSIRMQLADGRWVGVEPLIAYVRSATGFVIGLNGHFGTMLPLTADELRSCDRLTIELAEASGKKAKSVKSFECDVSEIGSTDVIRFKSSSADLTDEMKTIFREKKGLYDIEFKQIKVECTDGSTAAGKDIWIRLVEKHD